MNKGNSSNTATGRRKGGDTASGSQRTAVNAQNQVPAPAAPAPVPTLPEVNANFINAKVAAASSVLAGRINGPIVPDGNAGANYDVEPSDSEEDEDDEEVGSFADPDDDAIIGTPISSVDPETRARLQELLDAAETRAQLQELLDTADPEVIRKLRESVNCVMGEAGRSRSQSDLTSTSDSGDGMRSLVQACTSGDIDTVRMLLKQGSSVHETTEDGESLLSLAASAGYFELCQVLIAMNANVEDRGVKGDCTPLMEAANAGYADIVKLLCANGADVNAKSSVGNTALHYAACAGHESVVAALIDAGANVEEHNENGHTPLMEAASAGFVPIAKMLLSAGAGINTHSNEFKESALTLACYKGHLEMVKFLLQAGADQEHKTDEMHTALMEASMDGHVDVARLLLDSGAQVNMPTDSFESPLTLAACGGHVELANLLIERGANLEEANDEGYTPLMEAAREGHEEMCALLLAHGVDINAQTEETQETALTLACCGGFLEVADFLIKAGADIELGCSTPLMEASQEGHIELVKYLLKAGANVHAQTQTGDTALTYACENGHTDVAEILLEYGAELEHESEGGRTALMKAARVGHLCTVQFLINQGANVNKATTNCDHTVLSVACAGGHLSIVELLLKSGANPTTKLKDGSTMLIEAAKGGHTSVVNLLLDWTGARTPSSDDQSSSSQSSLDIQMQQQARVPVQGQGNLVPHSQDCLTTAEAAAYSCMPVTAGTMTAIGNFASAGGVPGSAAALSWNGLPIQYDICETHGCSHTGLVLQSNSALDLAGTRQGCPNHAHLCMSGHQHDDCKSLSCASLSPYIPTTLTRAPVGGKVVTAARSSTSAISLLASGAPMIPTNSPSSLSIRSVEGYDGNEGLDDHPSSSDLLDMDGSSAVDLVSDMETEAMLDFIAEEILSVNDRMRDCDGEGAGARRVLSSEELKGFIHSFIESAQRLGATGGSDTETDGKSSEEQAARRRQISEELRQIRKMLEQKNVDASLEGSPPLKPSGHSTQDQQDVVNDLNSSIEAIGNSSFNISSDSSSLSSTEAARVPPSGEEGKEKSPTNESSPDDSRNEPSDGREEISNVLSEQDCEDALNIISNEIANLDLDVGKDSADGSYDQQDIIDMNNPNIDLSTVVLLTDMHLNDASCQHLPQHGCLQQQQYQLYQQQQLQLEKMMQADATLHWHDWQQQQLSHLLSNDMQQQQLDQHQLFLLNKQQDEQLLAAALKQQQLQLQTSSGEVKVQSPALPVAVRDPSSMSQPRPKNPVQQQNTQTQGRVFARPSRKLQQNHQLHLQVQQQLQQQQKNKQLLEQQTTAFQFEGQSKSSVPPGANVAGAQGTNMIAGGTKGQVWQKRGVPSTQGGDSSAAGGHASLPQPLPKFARFTSLPCDQMSPPRNDLHHIAISGQMALAAAQSPTNHSAANNFIQSQHICQQQLCSVPLDMQQLKLQQQQFGKQQLGQQYLQQQELLQQAQQLQLQLQQTQHLHHIMQQQQKQGTTSVASNHTQHELLLQAQQFQQLLQTQQQYGLQKHLHTYPNLNTASPVLGSPLQLTAVSPGNFNAGSMVQQKGSSLKGIVPAPFHFSPQQLQQQPQLLTQQGNVGVATVAGGYESCMGGEAGLMAVTSGVSPNTSQATQTAANQMLPPIYPLPSIEVDAQTEGNHDTALTLACAGGHAELVSLLLSRGADIEHRDKKGFTPLILAATGGHTTVVEILLDNGADIEAQSERTKDSPLSLACSGGRFEVVELLLNRGANKEHRNVSDYTPLSLAASGGYVNIIKLLLQHGAEINSRTGSKLGISPLMLAAMNGHTTAVSLLLDMGSDINAQIETNRNTALTLACFQGRHEVVSLLVNRRANIEHRAKTGLTPLMEAASGGYVEVGRVLLDKGADIHAAPVPSSRDTVLTIAADKGHYRFVELLISRHAAIDVKNKKGNSPLWLACTGGHLEVVQLLVNAKADVDSQDNRKVSCLMAAFRRGHVKVVKWLVKHVTQFPSDAECMRYIATVADKDLLKKCHQCMELIVSAKDRQAAEANKNANILLEELDQEKSREESKRLAAARKREKKKQKKKDKLGVRDDKTPDAEDFCDNSSEEAGNSRTHKEKQDKADFLSLDQPDGAIEESSRRSSSAELVENSVAKMDASESKRNVDGAASSQSHGTSDKENKARNNTRRGGKKKKDRVNGTASALNGETADCVAKLEKLSVDIKEETSAIAKTVSNSIAQIAKNNVKTSYAKASIAEPIVITATTSTKVESNSKKAATASFTTSGIGDLDDFGTFPSDIRIPPITTVSSSRSSAEIVAPKKAATSSTASKTRSSTSAGTSATTSAGNRIGGSQRTAGISASTNQATRRVDKSAAARKEELDWKEVTRKGRKLHVPSKAISRIIGRGGCNINAIRDASGAHIDLDKVKDSTDGIITIRGSLDAQRLANDLLEALIREPDKDMEQILPVVKASISKTSSANSTSMITSIITPLVPVTAAPVNVWKTNVASAAAKISATTDTTKKNAPVAKPLMETSNMARIKTETGVFVVPGAAEDGTSGKPQPIKSFPIGAWTPVSSSGSKENSGHSSARRGVAGRGSGQREAATVVVTCVAGTTSTHRIVVSTVASIMSASSASKQSRVSTILTNSVTSVTPSKTNDPVPLPIINGNNPALSGRLHFGGEVSGMSVTQGSGSIVTAAGEYSPFSNLFTPLAESVMQKRVNNGEVGRNFASVAAAGVVTCSAHSPTSCANSQSTSISLIVISTPVIDSALQAKAPGYRPPSSFASPRIDSSTVSSPAGPIQQPSRAITEAPAANNFSKQLDFSEEIINKDQDSQENIVAEQRLAGFPHFEQRFNGATPTGLDGINGSQERDYGSEIEDEELKEYDTGIGINVGNIPGLNNTEYSSPRHPMTLPRIDSNLNPNAPDFTSKVSDSSYPSTAGDSMPNVPSQGISLPSNSTVGAVNPQYFSMQPKISFLQHQMPAMAGLKGGMIPGGSQGFSMMSGMPQPAQFGTHLVGMTPQRFDDPSNAMMFGMGGFSMHSQQHTGLAKSTVEGASNQGLVDSSLGQASKGYGQGVVRVSMSQQSLDVENSTPSSSNPPSPSSSSSTTDAASRPLQPIGTERLIKKPRVVPVSMPAAPATHFNMMSSSTIGQPAWTFGSGLPGAIGTTALMHPPDMSAGDWAPPVPLSTVTMPMHQAGPHGDSMPAPVVPASPIECLSGSGHMLGLPTQPLMPPPSMLPHTTPYMSHILAPPMHQGIMPGTAIDHRSMPGPASGYEPHTLQSMMTRGTSVNITNGGMSGMSLLPGAQMLTFPPPMPPGGDLMSHPPNAFQPPTHVEPWASAGLSQMKSTGNPQFWNMWKTS